MTDRLTPLDDASNGPTWDALVIGAGPAGSLAARELAGSGARVLLVDRSPSPRPKVCGACLNGRALDILRESGLGRLPEDLGGIPLDLVHLGHAKRSARLPLPTGIAVSRSRLDSALAKAAVDAGARFLPETRATVHPIPIGFQARAAGAIRSATLTRQGREIRINAKIIVAASGLGATCLTHEPSFRNLASKGARIGAGCRVETYPDFYRPGAIFMAVGRSGYVGLTRVEDGSLNVAAAFDKPFLARHGSPQGASAAVLAEAGFPAIRGFEDAPWKGTPGLTRRTRPLAGDRLFLIGDACGYVEPFTGEGMAWALMSARGVVPLALRGIDRWEPALAREWEGFHRRRIGRRQHLCRAMASLLRHPRLMRAAFELATLAPSAARLIIDRVNAPPHLSPMRPNLS